MQAHSADATLGRAAERIWSEGRVNPIDWEIGTTLGHFTTRDRATWYSDSGEWAAELRRSRNRRHVYLALFERGVYRGRYDASGWHAATERKRVRQLRSFRLPPAA
ncbi:MAG TPA: hypothetical protein VGJ60_09280 [Chloroflexota bacterium]|jgi:hypothetical protein